MQNFKIAVAKEDQCNNMRQRSEMGNITRNFNIHHTAEGCNNHDLSLTHVLPHSQSIKVYHQNIRN